MSRAIAILAATAVLAAAAPVFAQTVERSTTRSETSTTRDGDTTRTTTRTTTVGGSVDADAVVGALLGAIEGRADPEARDLRRRSEPVRLEDAYGVWLADDGGRGVGDCRLSFRDRAFLGVRGVSAEDCPSRLGRISNWRIENGEVVLYRGAGDQDPLRLMMVEGRLIGDGLTLAREGDIGPGPTADDLRGRDRGDRRGWAARPVADDYSGAWKHIETTNTGHRRECTLRLTTNPSFGALGASTRGCFGDLMFVSTWRFEDGRVALYRAGGVNIVMLRGGPSRLSGRTEDGEEIVLYR